MGWLDLDQKWTRVLESAAAARVAQAGRWADALADHVADRYDLTPAEARDVIETRLLPLAVRRQSMAHAA